MATAKGSGCRAPRLRPLVCPALLGIAGTGEVAAEEIPQSSVKEKTAAIPLLACTLVVRFTRISAIPYASLRVKFQEKLGKRQCSRIHHGSARAGDSEGMRPILTASLSKIPHHVVSGHLQSWHDVALGPSLYLPCSSSFLEPLLYHILSIPST